MGDNESRAVVDSQTSAVARREVFALLDEAACNMYDASDNAQFKVFLRLCFVVAWLSYAISRVRQ